MGGGGGGGGTYVVPQSRHELLQTVHMIDVSRIVFLVCESCLQLLTFSDHHRFFHYPHHVINDYPIKCSGLGMK